MKSFQKEQPRKATAFGSEGEEKVYLSLWCSITSICTIFSISFAWCLRTHTTAQEATTVDFAAVANFFKPTDILHRMDVHMKNPHIVRKFNKILISFANLYILTLLDESSSNCRRNSPKNIFPPKHFQRSPSIFQEISWFIEILMIMKRNFLISIGKSFLAYCVKCIRLLRIFLSSGYADSCHLVVEWAS